MNNLVSVIVPAYNQAKYLPAALDAVLAQTCNNWECIIINDGSTDESEKIAQSYAEKDPRFKYLKKDNGGLSSARNAGLKMAAGTWIQFLDSDDYIQPGKLELSFALLNEHPATQIVVCDFKMFIDSPADATAAFCALGQNRLNFESILFGWDAEFNIPIHCGLFKAELFTENTFNESLKANEDWVLWLGILRQPVKALYLNYPLAYYRNNPDSMTKDKTFARHSLAEAIKYILQILPPQYTGKFAIEVVDRYQSVIDCYENDVTYYKNKLPVRIEKTIKNSLNRFLSPKKR